MMNEFHLLVEALWCGEIGEREFVAKCAQIGIAFDRVQEALDDLRMHDGVGVAA